jgi:hypothetical protein
MQMFLGRLLNKIQKIESPPSFSNIETNIAKGIMRWAQIKIHSVRSGSYHKLGKDKLNRATDWHTMEMSRGSDKWSGVMVGSDTTEVSKHYL